MATPLPAHGEAEPLISAVADASPATGYRAAAGPWPSRVSSRLVRPLIVCDLALAGIAYAAAAALSLLDDQAGRLSVNWSMLVLLSVTLTVFYLLGLYEREVFVSRPLHLWTLVRALFFSFLLGAGAIYLLRLPIVLYSRAVVVATFALFFLLVAVVRVGLLSHLYSRRVAAGYQETLLVGDADRTDRLRERLHELRVFNHVRLLDTGCGGPDSAVWFKALLAQSLRANPTPPSNVFIDAGNLRPETVFDLIGIARRSGSDVYIVSNLVRSLSCRRLLFDLFEAPVVRVRRAPHEGGRSVAERVFDITVSAAVLVLVSPLMLAIALAVRLTSPGPAILAQERLGKGGRPFKFYKFRSMTVCADDRAHVEYMQRFIKGAGQASARGDATNPELLYKLVDDARITRVGHYLRKFSLDELPQFWNVLMGDMSVVGPRPPLPYEADEYESWHEERLASKPGVSGLWQVQGRSRVTFDEMVFQDVMYTLTRGVLVDTLVCLRTVPAAVVGHGAA